MSIASQQKPVVVSLGSTVRLLQMTMRPVPAAYSPGVSAEIAFEQSGLTREPGMRFTMYLARVSWAVPSKDTVPHLHGQVFWVVRGLRTAHPYLGLPPPITASDRKCASLSPPVAILTATTGRHVLTTT
jgi:hypothetical protein